MQQTIIVGNLGGDPEMRYLPGGAAVTNISVAVRQYLGEDSEGQPRQGTVWFRCAIWGKRAEAANTYLVKGQQVTVIGQLTFDPETGAPKTFQRADGTTGTSFELRVSDIVYGQSRSSSAPTSPSSNGEAAPAEKETEEIPF